MKDTGRHVPKNSITAIDLADAKFLEASPEVLEQWIREINTKMFRGTLEVQNFIRLNRMPEVPTKEQLQEKKLKRKKRDDGNK